MFEVSPCHKFASEISLVDFLAVGTVQPYSEAFEVLEAVFGLLNARSEPFLS